MCKAIKIFIETIFLVIASLLLSSVYEHGKDWWNTMQNYPEIYVWGNLPDYMQRHLGGTVIAGIIGIICIVLFIAINRIGQDDAWKDIGKKLDKLIEITQDKKNDSK